MNKKIIIKKHTLILFIINVLSFLMLILFSTIYQKLNYWHTITFIMLLLNLITIMVGITFNTLFFIKDKYSEKDKRNYVIPIIVFVVLQLFNSAGVIIINKIHDSSYSKMTNQLATYCDPEYYYCDSYEIIRNSKYNDFVAQKVYYDYNGKKNNIEIHTTYTVDKVKKVEAIIYSHKESYSEYLIMRNIEKYFSNYGYDVDDKKIKEAFDNRFKGSIKDENTSYKVTEIYKKKRLNKLKTVIKLNLD